MDYDFDRLIDRSGTDSLKWQRYAGRKILPMWVADMDFMSTPELIDAISKRVQHGIFGYPVPPKGLAEAFQEHAYKMYGWRIEPDWIVWIPGVVTGLNIACRALARSGQQVAMFTPIYPPFLSAPRHAGQDVLRIPLLRHNGRYVLDIERFRSSITPNTRLLLFCNPHNPVGRSFRLDELQQLANVCLEKDILICSDEIHCDLILDDLRHIPFSMVSKDVQDRTITLTAPSKTFNIPGLGCALAIIPNGRLRRAFLDAKAGIVPHVNILGFHAALAAYRYGEPWRKELIRYLRANRDLLIERINQIPGLHLDHVEATYLAWIDATGLGVMDPAGFFEQAGVGLSDGTDFDGPGFVRLNFACPRSILEEAIKRLSAAIDRL